MKVDVGGDVAEGQKHERTSWVLVGAAYTFTNSRTKIVPSSSSKCGRDRK